MKIDHAKRALKVARRQNPKLKAAKLAVAAIEVDICDRRGLKHEWQAIDGEIVEEIKAVWVSIIKGAMRGAQ